VREDVLVSHIFPHLAICDAAQKFAKSEDTFEKFLDSAIAVLTKHTNLDEDVLEKVLQQVLDIHSSWTSAIPDRTATATDQNRSSLKPHKPAAKSRAGKSSS
jgi:hypothetical protein